MKQGWATRYKEFLDQTKGFKGTEHPVSAENIGSICFSYSAKIVYEDLKERVLLPQPLSDAQLRQQTIDYTWFLEQLVWCAHHPESEW